MDPIRVALQKSKIVIFEDITKLLTFIFLNPTLGSILNKIKFLTTDMIFLTLLSNGTTMVPQKANYLKRGGLDYFYFLIC